MKICLIKLNTFDIFNYSEREREREEKVLKAPRDLQREKEIEEELRERKKAEKKAREKEAAYQERLRNWEIRERRRAKEYEREKEKELEKEEEREKEAKRLKEVILNQDHFDHTLINEGFVVGGNFYGLYVFICE